MSIEELGETRLIRYTGEVFVDNRGSLKCINDFDMSNVKRFYQIKNHRKGFIRAWHGHREEAKYVYVASGSALIGTVDLENEKLVSKIVLSAEKPQVLYIPKNHANGFMNLEDDTRIIFFSNKSFEDTKDDDIRFPYDRWDIWSIEYR